MDWIRSDSLGHGSFAKVDLAFSRAHCPVFPPLMAVKSCGISHASSLMTEKLILEELHGCPEVIRCYGDSVSCENGEKLYNVLLEYASGGSLADKLGASDGRRIPESEARQYTKALLRGLDYIHKFGYVHCDIKLQNILLCADGGVKIADFGLAKRAGRRGGSELRGTPMYMSPEMVAGREQGTAADIWSLGCLVSEMISGCPAWRCSEVAALIMKIGLGEEVPEIPGIASEEGKDFLRKCFAKDPKERWTAEMLLDHPFVRDEVYAAKKGDAAAAAAAASPRCPFDFQEWVSSSITSPVHSGSWFPEESTSPAERLLGLFNEQGPDWSVSEDWVTVR